MSLPSTPRVVSDGMLTATLCPADLGAPLLGRVPVEIEPLGSNHVIAGEIRELSTNEIVMTATATIATGGRAFIGIEDPDNLPVVGLVEIISSRADVDEAGSELRARFVRLSEANADRLARLAGTTTSRPDPSPPERHR